MSSADAHISTTIEDFWLRPKFKLTCKEDVEQLAKQLGSTGAQTRNKAASVLSNLLSAYTGRECTQIGSSWLSAPESDAHLKDQRHELLQEQLYPRLTENIEDPRKRILCLGGIGSKIELLHQYVKNELSKKVIVYELFGFHWRFRAQEALQSLYRTILNEDTDKVSLRRLYEDVRDALRSYNYMLVMVIHSIDHVKLEGFVPDILVPLLDATAEAGSLKLICSFDDLRWETQTDLWGLSFRDDFVRFDSVHTLKDYRIEMAHEHFRSRGGDQPLVAGVDSPKALIYEQIFSVQEEPGVEVELSCSDDTDSDGPMMSSSYRPSTSELEKSPVADVSGAFAAFLGTFSGAQEVKVKDSLRLAHQGRWRVLKKETWAKTVRTNLTTIGIEPVSEDSKSITYAFSRYVQ